jgi:hypothetical protein
MAATAPSPAHGHGNADAAAAADSTMPSLTLLELVSHSASSSALPDSFGFSVSRKGLYVAVYSAATLWLIKTAHLPRLWARTLGLRRKPVALDIADNGFLLAVLSRPSQVDLYELHGHGDADSDSDSPSNTHGAPIRIRRTIRLVHDATSIVLSPDARILIASNQFGIEVIAVAPAAPESARRTLSGPVGDALQFSDDGRTLLITAYARNAHSSALFVLPGLYDGPLDVDGAPIPQPPDAIWTTSVLFPETARIARQATLLPDADSGTANELFAFSADDDSWGIYDIACQRFTQRKMFLPDHQRWTRSEFVDDAMPAVSPNADLAAVALRMRGTTNIWIYEVPGWDPRPSEKPREHSPIQPAFCIPIPKLGAAAYQEICLLRWLRLDANVQRLVAVGNSSVVPAETDVPDLPTGSKGVIIVLDFDRTKPPGGPAPVPLKMEYDLDPLCPGDMLPEGTVDFNHEVELMRTRTLAYRRAQDSAGSRRNSRPPQRTRTTTAQAPRSPPVPDDHGELTAEEAQAAFEMPYDNQQPRSQVSLARAATVAAVSPANRRHLRALPFRPLEYRRADGAREHPHESDADNWVPPPPAYTATAEAAQSVSLSHPTPSSPSSTPPVPALAASVSATVNPSQLSPLNPYPTRRQSVSSVDLSLRRPSLIHPTTYPSPHSPAPTRRRSSAATAQSPPLQMSYSALPQSHPPSQQSYFERRDFIPVPVPPAPAPQARERLVSLPRLVPPPAPHPAHSAAAALTMSAPPRHDERAGRHDGGRLVQSATPRFSGGGGGAQGWGEERRREGHFVHVEGGYADKKEKRRTACVVM